MSQSTKVRQVPPPADGKAHPYTRFIPREELAGFAAWALGDLSTGDPSAAPGGIERRRRAPAEPPPVDAAEALAQQLKAARQSGYQDGYRDGLVALDGFKQSFAVQTTAQVGVLVAAIGAELDALQQAMAASVATIATGLARRVVRSELATHPERIAKVAAEAIDALLLSARHIVVRVHPDDAPLVAAGAGETLEARGARLVGDPAVSRGGCRVDSDIGGVDAQIEERWRQAAASLGDTSTWVAQPPVILSEAKDPGGE